MKINTKNISRISVLIILAGFALQACTSPTTSIDQSVVEESAVTSPVSDQVEAIDEVLPETNQESSTEVESASVLDTTSESVEAASNVLANGLTRAEVDSLTYMREEEKLAHDVYLTLYDIWGLNLFQNIADSEQTHTDSVAGLLYTYNIPDPADTSPVGEFVNPELQALYDDLVAWGSQSLGDALKVGAAIEEIDILDLEEALTFVSANDIQNVYQNLLSGSENHLRAFTSTLERQTGEVYEPQYMDADDYAAIGSGSSSRGNQGGGNQGYGNRP